MIVYSEQIAKFIQELKLVVKTVLSQEIGLQVYSHRFWSKDKRYSYPISIVIYTDGNILGYFDPDFYQLGFHERLMHMSKEQLRRIVRHELAHYMTFINYGGLVASHGPEFKAFCREMRWEEEVSCATFSLSEEKVLQEQSSVFRKVEKLLALATSSNKHEAELAMIKSQQLLLKHNIESEYLSESKEERMYLKRILRQKRKSAKAQAISRILETFFVNVVYHGGKGFFCLEILGSAVNVEIAEYVASLLDRQLELLWDEVKEKTEGHGIRAKNSFFLGVAKGYCNKIEHLKRDYSEAVSRSLVCLEQKLARAKSIAYPKLSSSRSQAGFCPTSRALGEQMGQQLSINPGLSGSSPSSCGYLTLK